MSTWLVTGGAGFIGSHFVRLAAEATPHTVLVLDALTYAGNRDNLPNHPRVRFVHGDVCDQALLTQLFADHDVRRVVHLAAESHVDRSIAGSEVFLRTNIEGTHRLLEAARTAWGAETDGRLFLHVSTDEVFGDLAPTDRPWTETSPYLPSSPYAASKAASDHLVRAWHRTYGLPIIVTSCCNNYGPRQLPEKLIPLMISRALEGRELPVYGDGGQVRDWLHVEDHCRALLAVLERGAPGETYLIGARDERTNLEIVHRICRAVDGLTGRPSGTTARQIRHVPDRPGHDRRYAVDPHKLQTALGWAPRRTLDEALPEVVQWYLEHGTRGDAAPPEHS